jgi:hypothetical protein
MHPTKWNLDKCVGVIARKTVRRLDSCENPLSGGERRLQPSGVGPARLEQPTPIPLPRTHGGESSSFLVVPIFMLCGAGHAGMDGSFLIKMDLSKTLGEN